MLLQLWFKKKKILVFFFFFKNTIGETQMNLDSGVSWLIEEEKKGRTAWTVLQMLSTFPCLISEPSLSALSHSCTIMEAGCFRPNKVRKLPFPDLPSLQICTLTFVLKEKQASWSINFIFLGLKITNLSFSTSTAFYCLLLGSFLLGLFSAFWARRVEFCFLCVSLSHQFIFSTFPQSVSGPLTFTCSLGPSSHLFHLYSLLSSPQYICRLCVCFIPWTSLLSVSLSFVSLCCHVSLLYMDLNGKKNTGQTSTM